MARSAGPAAGGQAAAAAAGAGAEARRSSGIEVQAEGAAGKSETFGTKTLAQLRSEAIQQRRDALSALMPARGAKLAELFHLLNDRHDPARFGAGLDPSRSLADLSKALIPDETIDKALAEFTEKWIRSPGLALQISIELPPLRPTPPPSPIRRDSTTVEMSEEVAALERELIKSDYNAQPGQPSDSNTGVSNPQITSQTTHLATDQDSHMSASPTSPRKRAPSSAISPYPVTFRSPAALAGQQSAPPSEPPASNFPLTIQPSQLTIDSTHRDMDTEMTQPPIVKEEEGFFPLRGYQVPYNTSLPPLPDYLIKNRLNVGGLAAKKARERAAVAQNPALANTVSTSSDLYKLGISKATHASVRSLMGAGAPQPGKTRTGSKVLLTSDWNVAISELQSLRALERIEQLKADKTWSFRQVRKQRAPGTQKAHWDYLLDEMKWLAVDYKQETRWKKAAAYEMSQAVKEWHNAPDDDAKKLLCVRVREPAYLSGQVNPAEDTEILDVVPDSQEGPAVEDGDISMATDSQSQSAFKGPVKQTSAATPVSLASGSAQTPTSSTSALPAQPDPPPRQKRYQNQLVTARAPVFDLPPSQTVFTLAESALPETYKELASHEVVNELFQDLPLYQAPAEPSSDPRQNRRIDEASPHYSRITTANELLESKPILMSTLHPSKKRKRSGDWKDMMDVAGEEGRDPMLDMFGSASDIAFGGGIVKPKDSGNKRFNPAPPANAEARSAGMDWSAEEDRQLFIFARQYSFNWDLISHVFNSTTKRPRCDARLPWDCFDRWTKKFAPPPPPTPAAQTPQAPGSATLPMPNGAAAGTPVSASAASPVTTAQQQQQQSPLVSSASQAHLQPHKRDKRGSVPVVAGPASAVLPPRKPEMPKSQIRHLSMVEAAKKVQKRREIQQKQNMLPAVRKVNLSGHETHNHPLHPNLAALDLIKMKAERERQQLEDTRAREQQRMFQQAQAASMAQQQQMAQMQQRAGMPMPGPNVQRLPPGAVPNMQANQAAILQGQRAAAGQMPPPHLAAAMQQQQQQQQQLQNQPRPMQPPQQANRPPSSSGNGGQPMPIPNGQLQVSPPMQHPGLPPGVQIPMQMNQQRISSPSMSAQPSQSPQPVQMQLSPQQLQMQLQQASQQMSPAQQQAILAQMAARSSSPMQVPGMPQMQGMQIPQNMPPEQQQQFIAYMRMRQSSQASQAGSQGGQ